MELRLKVWDNEDYMTKSFTLQDLQIGKVLFTEDCTVRFSVGVKDRYGKIVYTGDIVKCPKGRNDVIEFKHGSAWLRYRNCTLYRFLVELEATIEVIGNEFENKDLL